MQFAVAAAVTAKHGVDKLRQAENQQQRDQDRACDLVSEKRVFHGRARIVAPSGR